MRIILPDPQKSDISSFEQCIQHKANNEKIGMIWKILMNCYQISWFQPLHMLFT